MATSKELGEQLAKADAVVHSATAAWVEDQAAHIAEFLDAEARLTAVNQAAHTEEIAVQIPALRERLAVARDEAVARFRTWSEDRVGDPAEVRQSFKAESPRFARAWIEVMLEAGYQGGLARRGESRPAWGFYDPTTGTARRTFMPASAAMVELEKSVRDRKSVAFSLEKASESEQRARAGDLWDD
jgi:hypothetical protein